jgi:hypothetical protein
VQLAARDAREAAGELAGGHEQRYERGRREQQRRHQHELRRDRVARPHVELDLLRDGIGRDEPGRAEDRDVAIRRGQQRQRDDAREQERAQRDVHQPLAGEQRHRGALVCIVDELLDVGVVLGHGASLSSAREGARSTVFWTYVRRRLALAHGRSALRRCRPWPPSRAYVK